MVWHKEEKEYEKDDRISEKTKERLRNNMTDLSDEKPFKIYDDMVKQLGSSSTCCEGYTWILPSSGYVKSHSGIKEDAKSMRLYISEHNPNAHYIGHPVEKSQIDFSKSRYTLYLGGQRIKMGYYSEGIDILDRFTPFRTCAQHYDLWLEIEFDYNADREIKVDVEIVMSTVELPMYVAQKALSHGLMVMPWICKDFDGNIEAELLQFDGGVGGLVLLF